MTPVDLFEALNKSIPSFPHKTHHLEKHKIEHKFEIKTAILLILFVFHFPKNRIETPLLYARERDKN